MLRHLMVPLAATGLVLACTRQSTSAGDRSLPSAVADSTIPLYLRDSGVDRRQLVIELTASKTVAAPGDTVHFTAIARNLGSDTIQVGVQCGPAMDVRITTPTGAVSSALVA